MIAISGVKCSICGTFFNTSTGNARYCSDACRKKAKQNRTNKFKTNHKDYMANYMREYRLKKRESST